MQIIFIQIAHSPGVFPHFGLTLFWFSLKFVKWDCVYFLLRRGSIFERFLDQLLRRLGRNVPMSPWRYFLFFFSFFFFFLYFFISWRLITLQYCSGFCHTLTWISHGFTCAPHPEPPSHLPPHPIPLGHPSAPALSTCLMYSTWTDDLFHTGKYTCFNAVLSDHPTLAFSHRVQKSVLYICVLKRFSLAFSSWLLSPSDW